MSALAILAIVAGALLAAVFAVGVATTVKTRAMRDRDLALAEALAGEKPPPSLTAPALKRSQVSEVSQEAAERRRILEQATSRWADLGPGVQSEIVQREARRWGEDPEELRTFINDLIQTGRRLHAGVLLLGVEPGLLRVERGPLSAEPEPLSAEPEPFERTPAEAVTWYRDQLLALHPAYLASHASLLERVTQLIALAIRVERDGEIPQRRRPRLNPQNLR